MTAFWPYRFIFAAEFYGGHYGKTFVAFDEQNVFIGSGETDGLYIEVPSQSVDDQQVCPILFQPLSFLSSSSSTLNSLGHLNPPNIHL